MLVAPYSITQPYGTKLKPKFNTVIPDKKIFLEMKKLIIKSIFSFSNNEGEKIDCTLEKL